MDSKKNILLHRFIEEFTPALIEAVRSKKIVAKKDESPVVHADMIPRLSERANKILLERPILRKIKKIESRQPIIKKKKILSKQVHTTNTLKINPYDKILPLLHDPSISLIECSGPKKPIVVTRMGRKQITKIVLDKKEIHNFLEKIAEEVHLPLLEGVFRAMTENFSINAVISESIGSRFIIQKRTGFLKAPIPR